MHQTWVMMKDSLKIVYLNQIILVIWYNIDESKLFGKSKAVSWFDCCCSVMSGSFAAIDCSLPGFYVPGISQAGILEWITISFSRVYSQPRDRAQVSCNGKHILYHWATTEAPSWFRTLQILTMDFNWLSLIVLY